MRRVDAEILFDLYLRFREETSGMRPWFRGITGRDREMNKFIIAYTEGKRFFHMAEFRKWLQRNARAIGA